MRFYELFDKLEFDHDKLIDDLFNNVSKLGAQVIQGKEYETPLYHGFGGWSITSRSGEWSDGWDFFQNVDGDELEVFFKPENIFKAKKFFGISHSLEHKNPTQAYVGEIAKVVDQLVAMGMYPRRVRVTCLRAHCKSLVHRDANDNEYSARLHIPLVTNPKCVFICEGESLHMEVGKVYLVSTNLWHQIRNDSDHDRYHIICDFYDVGHNTQNFKYEGDFSQLEDLSLEIRKRIDEAVIEPELYEEFEAVRQKFITNP